MDKKRRKIGLSLTLLAMVLWFVFASKEHRKMPNYPPTPQKYSKFVKKHIEDESSNLFYFKTNNMQHNVIHAKQSVNAIEVFDSAVAASGNSQPKYAQMVKANYKLLLGGEDKISGRDAWTLSLLPKQRNFPWKQLWIDKKTFVVLAMKNWSSQNKIKPLSVAKMPNSAKNKAFDKKIVDVLKKNHTYIPKGFVLSGFQASSLDWHCSFTDGLNSISIFVIFYSKPHKTEISNSGNAFVHSSYSKGKEIIVIADLPIEELSKISNSIK